jgi:hypothetical protein
MDAPVALLLPPRLRVGLRTTSQYPEHFCHFHHVIILVMTRMRSDAEINVAMLSAVLGQAVNSSSPPVCQVDNDSSPRLIRLVAGELFCET